jgi:GNAT superfamily N-acetyltransferase
MVLATLGRYAGSVYRVRVLMSRIAGQADSAEIARLWTVANESRQAETGLPLGPVADGDLAEAVTEVGQRLSDPAGFALLVEDDGHPVAVVVVVQGRADDGASPKPMPGVAHVSMVAVHPGHWGSGLGRNVLRAAEDLARKRGFTRAQLWTHDKNQRARNLYSSLGWTPTDRTIGDEGGPKRQYVRNL